MSPYSQIPQISPAKPGLDNEEDNPLEYLQQVPSNFDLALNGGTNRPYLSPNASKTADASLLDPEAFRRLSISTISSLGQSVEVSPFPRALAHEPNTWRDFCRNVWVRNQGLFLVLISQLFGALMNVITRLLELEGEGMHPFRVLFWRMTLTSIFCCSWMYWNQVPDFPLGAKGVRLLLTVRGFTGFFGIFGMYCKSSCPLSPQHGSDFPDSLQYLPVADAVVLTFLSPSLASYGCYILLKEPFPRSAQYASLISLVGVILIARPTSFFSSTLPPAVIHGDSMSSTNTTAATGGYESSFPTPTSAQRLSAVAVAMLGVLGGAGALTCIRWIGSRCHALISVNYFSVWCTIVSGMALSLSKPLHLSELSFGLPTGLRQWSMLIFLGVCGFVAQFLMTKGLAEGGRGESARATNMIYMNMLFALALDKLFFGQSPGWWSLAGSGLILGSAVFVALQNQQGTPGRDVDEEIEGRAGGVGREDEEMHILGGNGDVDIEDEAEELRHLSR